jgi:hypothetical protein
VHAHRRGYTLGVEPIDAVGTCHRHTQMGSHTVDSGLTSGTAPRGAVANSRRLRAQTPKRVGPAIGRGQAFVRSGRIVHKSVKKSPSKLRGKRHETTQSAVETGLPFAHFMSFAPSDRGRSRTSKTVSPGASGSWGGASDTDVSRSQWPVRCISTWSESENRSSSRRTFRTVRPNASKRVKYKILMQSSASPRRATAEGPGANTTGVPALRLR